MTVHENKWDLLKTKINYLAQLIDENRRTPAPSWIEVIENMPASCNKTTLQAFLGLVSYYQLYVPKILELRALSRALLMNDTKWEWTNECQKAFEEFKKRGQLQDNN